MERFILRKSVAIEKLLYVRNRIYCFHLFLKSLSFFHHLLTAITFIVTAPISMVGLLSHQTKGIPNLPHPPEVIPRMIEIPCQVVCLLIVLSAFFYILIGLLL